MRAGTAASSARRLVVAALSVAAACNPTQRTRASAEPSASSTSLPRGVTASAASAVEAPADAKAWTDPVVIDRLAQDCRWAPPEKERLEEGEKAPPLSCAVAVAEQSRAPDPCFEAKERECEPECKRICERCGDACATQCEACKAPCTDDACRRTCATQCSACRQGCLASKDRCATGKCRGEQRACDAKLVADWMQGGCTAACTRFRACAACENGDFGSAACIKCRARAMEQCPARFEMMCAFGVDPTGPDR